MKFFCIDIGSTYVKIVLADTALGISASYRIPSPAREGQGHVFEINAASCLQILRDEINKALDDGFGVEGLLISTQMHGFVYNDKYVSWQDTSCLDTDPTNGRTYLEQLKLMVPEEAMSNSGVKMKPSLGICNLYARLKRKEELSCKAEIYTLGSWIIHQLTGRNICHISNAAPLGLIDLSTRSWDRNILTKLGLDNLKLPEIAAEDYAPVGTYHYRGGEILVFPDYGDQQVSVCGISDDKDSVIINAATAAQVIRKSSAPLKTGCENRPYFEGKYLNVITNLPSGRNLQVLIRFLQTAVERITGETVDESEVWKALNTDRISDELIIDPRFYPDQGSSDGGSITGINANSFNPDTLMSAMFSAMAEEFRKAIQSMKISDDEEIPEIICIGGVCRKNPSMIEKVESATGIKCRIPDDEDEAISGFIKIANKCEERYGR